MRCTQIREVPAGTDNRKHSSSPQESLQRLVLTGLTMSSLEEPSHHRFSSLQGLRSLSLANVDFYDAGLADVCSLPRLESLDLSNTSVTNLSPLLGLRERLRSLTLHQLKRLEMSTAQLLAVIGQLEALQVGGDNSNAQVLYSFAPL
jgi:Zyg-11 family protein